ncbi:MAG TPA: tyrosine-type recombinase/integrase [Rhodothermales bacterium]
MRLLQGTPQLVKHKGRYNAVFYDRETKRRAWHSLGTSKKDLAERRFREIVQASESGKFDPFRERYEWQKLTVKVAAERFQKARGGQWTDHTRKDYKRFLNMLASSLPAGTAIHHLSAADCRKIIDRASSSAGRNSYYRRLSSFLNWCVSKRYIPHSPLSDVDTPKLSRQPPEYFTHEEHADLVSRIERASEITEESRDQNLARLARITRFAANSGLRLAEILNLRWRDVDFSAGRITVCGKGKKYRSVPLFPDARSPLDEIRREHRKIYGSAPPREMQVFAGMVYDRTSKDFKTFVRAKGMDDRYNFHSLRHTFASWAVMAGVPIYVVREWMGHASVTTTEIYAHLAPDYVPDAATDAFSKASQKRRSVGGVLEHEKGRVPEHSP